MATLAQTALRPHKTPIQTRSAQTVRAIDEATVHVLLHTGAELKFACGLFISAMSGAARDILTHPDATTELKHSPAEFHRIRAQLIPSAKPASPGSVSPYNYSNPRPFSPRGIQPLMAILTLRIDNMHCGSCIRRVTMALNGIPHTHAEEVRVGSARIVSAAPPEQIQQALTNAGYPTLVESSGE